MPRMRLSLPRRVKLQRPEAEIMYVRRATSETRGIPRMHSGRTDS
jgi:hypothetical protein